MAAITASMVKELRELTGAGMMDCKKALTETDGNMDAAVDFLKKSGAVKAEKKASRIAAEGICRVAMGDGKAAVVEVNSETDFVAKNETFQNFVQAVADQALATSAADVAGMMDEKFVGDPDKTVNEALVEKIATIGEKLSIRRFAKVEGDAVVSYIHGGGRIGVLVAAKCDDANDAVKEALTNIAMQVAAMNPQYISSADISADEKAKMQEITVDQALNTPDTLPRPILQKLIDKAVADKVWSDADITTYGEQKNNMQYLFNFLSEEAKAGLAKLAMDAKAAITSDKIFSGLVSGRVSKQQKEVCLLEQTYVKAEDGKQTVANYLASVSKSIVITKYVRFEVGEGMEKKNENFAEEVAKQMQG